MGETRWMVLFKADGDTPFEVFPHEHRSAALELYEEFTTNWSEVWLCEVQAGPIRPSRGTEPDEVPDLDAIREWSGLYLRECAERGGRGTGPSAPLAADILLATTLYEDAQWDAMSLRSILRSLAADDRMALARVREDVQADVDAVIARLCTEEARREELEHHIEEVMRTVCEQDEEVRKLQHRHGTLLLALHTAHDIVRSCIGPLDWVTGGTASADVNVYLETRAAKTACIQLCDTLLRILREPENQPPGLVPDEPDWDQVIRRSMDRDWLGMIVRDAWISWAVDQPDVMDHPTWTVPWLHLPERDKEADRQIGAAVAKRLIFSCLVCDEPIEMHEYGKAPGKVFLDGTGLVPCEQVGRKPS